MTWSFYDPATGLFIDRHFSGSTIERATPPGMLAIKGRYSPLSHRVDIATGEVVPYTPPPQPDSPAIAAIKARARIRELERQQQRPLRELALDPLHLAAKQRLREIEDEIVTLRDLLTPQ